jgi:hypothetical protein
MVSLKIAKAAQRRLLYLLTEPPVFDSIPMNLDSLNSSVRPASLWLKSLKLDKLIFTRQDNKLYLFDNPRGQQVS